jgi:hypothetical protein
VKKWDKEVHRQTSSEARVDGEVVPLALQDRSSLEGRPEETKKNYDSLSVLLYIAALHCK